MEVLRQKGWGCGLADRNVVALSQVNASELINEGERGHRRECGADRCIDDARSFAGAIAFWKRKYDESGADRSKGLWLDRHSLEDLYELPD